MKRSIWHKEYCILRKELLKLRKEHALTQVQLSKLLNKPQSFVSKYEIGDRNLDLIEVLHICNTCKVDPAKFITLVNNLIIDKK